MALYATEAAVREKILSNVTYDLVLSLSKHTDTYEGRLKTSFIINDIATKQELTDLFFDFHGKKIYDMFVNN